MFIHENEDGTSSVTGSVNHAVLDAYNDAKASGGSLEEFAPYLAANSAEAQAAQGAPVSYPAGIEPSPEAKAADERAVQAAQSVQEGSDQRSAALAEQFNANKSATTQAQQSSQEAPQQAPQPAEAPTGNQVPEDAQQAPQAPAGDDYDTLTKEQLQDQLSARGLPTSGNKPELVDRLRGVGG